VTQKKPRFKDKETRIAEIQKAARRVFFEKGYQASTIDQVAREAGVAKGTVYFYFDNKDDLYISLMIPTVKDLIDRLRPVEQDLDAGRIPDGPELIGRLMDGLYEWAQADPDGFRIATTFQQGGLFSRMSGETLERLNEVGREGFGRFRRVLSKGRTSGFFNAPEADIVLSDIMWSAFLGIMQFEENKKRVTGKDHVRSTLDSAVRLIARSACPGAGEFPAPKEEV